MFNIFQSLDLDIYLSIIISILILSLLTTLSSNSKNTYLKTLWSYASVILSDYCTLKPRTGTDRLLIGVWLMSCTVLLAAISGIFREFLIKAKPIYYVDTWNDLARWNHLTINTFKATGLHNYIINYGHEPLARQLAERTKILEYDEFKSGKLQVISFL